MDRIFMKTIYMIICTILLTAGISAGSSVGSPYSGSASQTVEQGIRTLLESRDHEIKELMGPRGTEYTEEQRERLRHIINDIIDLEAMASQALGETYHEISEEEREEFVSLFADIIRDQSLSRLDIYRADVTYEEIEVDGDHANVQTIAR